MRKLKYKKLKTVDQDSHPSFGMIGWARQTCVGGTSISGVPLFGSDLKHTNLIAIRIHGASRERSLSKSWIHSDELVCEVTLSAQQFSDFITTPNQGDGIPCTIKHTQKEYNIEYPGFTTEQELHNKEFKQDCGEFRAESKSVLAEMASMRHSGAIKKGDFIELQRRIDKLIQNYEENMPFVEKSFRRSMEKTVTAGKAEIEAYINQRIQSAGLKALANDFQGPTLLEKDDD